MHLPVHSCNIGEGGIALAEAVHGSAPDIAGKVGNQYVYFNCLVLYLTEDYILLPCCQIYVKLRIACVGAA